MAAGSGRQNHLSKKLIQIKVETQELSITTKKGHQLSATRFTGQKKILKTLVISSATGVLQGFYKKFAQYFALLGYTVYTFDYSGIGKSGSDLKALKKNTSDLKSWGSIDQAAVVEYAKEQEPNNNLILITHSIGGQILGFNNAHTLIDKVVLVASQTGYWKHFKGLHYPKMWLLWYVIIPVLTPLFGYFPAKKLGLFENLPKNMVYEWSKWGKKKDYMMHFYNGPDYFFDKIDIPILSLSFPKDHFAPGRTVDWLTAQYRNAQVERVHYIPDSSKLSQLKHFGFFRETFKEELWKMAYDWISKT